MPQQGYGQEDGQPYPAGRVLFVVHEHQGDKGQQRQRFGIEPGHGHGKNQDDEEIEQGPPIDPGAADGVGAAGIDQAPAGGEKQGSADLLKIVIPTGCRQLAPARIIQAVRSQVELPPAQLHRRAVRWAVKLFLAHYHEVSYLASYGAPPPLPYIIERGHAHKIERPE